MGQIAYQAKIGIQIYPEGTKGSKTRIARLIIKGNVGSEGRKLMDKLGLTCVSDIANCREYWSDNNSQLMSVRKSLIDGFEKLNIKLEENK